MELLVYLSVIVIMAQSSFGKSYKFIAMEQRRPHKCEKVKSDTCLKRVSQGYNSTMFPNHFNHQNQEDAIEAMKDFIPLIEYGCSKYLATFLCSIYLPICTPGLTKPIKPCRGLCEKAAEGCAQVMKKHGFKWNFDCKEFPSEKSRNSLCLGVAGDSENEVSSSSSKKKKTKKIKKKGRRVYGKENDKIEIRCPHNKYIWIKKVTHSRKSSCCRSASATVLAAMCHGKSTCQLTVSPSSLGGHCRKGSVGKINIRYKCSNQISKKC